MGADLIVNVLAYPAREDFRFNWPAGDEAIDTLSLEAMASGLEESIGEYPWRDDEEDSEGEVTREGGPDPEACRTEVRAIFEKLKEEVVDPDGYPPRDVTTIKVRDLWILLSGGMSWGDMPTEACEHIEHAGYFPDVLTAIGFVLDWDEEPAHV